jgi:hypothetical protein
MPCCLMAWAQRQKRPPPGGQTLDPVAIRIVSGQKRGDTPSGDHQFELGPLRGQGRQ